MSCVDVKIVVGGTVSVVEVGKGGRVTVTCGGNTDKPEATLLPSASSVDENMLDSKPVVVALVCGARVLVR